jgi:hypothetical protein
VTKQFSKETIANEFQNTAINDKRLVNRLVSTAIILEKEPEKSIPEACQEWAAIKGAYNLFDNLKVTPDAVLSGHREQTIRRMQKHKVVLIIQDTTSLDFTTHAKTKGLGPYTTMPNSMGLLAHNALVVTPHGVPLGLLDQDIWARDPKQKGKKRERHKLPIELKESYKWIRTLKASMKDIPASVMPITVADREADIFELFKYANENQHHFLIRAVQNRCVNEEYKLLRAQIENTPIAGQCEVEIPRKSEQNVPSRTVRLNISFCQVTLRLANNSKDSAAIKLYAVLAKEVTACETDEPIEWLLLTNLPVNNLEDAVEKVGWYRQRWKIERFHYVLKVGCKIEELQLQTSERLVNAIALYSIIAWRLLWMTYQSRETPDAPCSIILEKNEWQILTCIANKTSAPPKKVPTIREAVRSLAKLGGFIGRKGDGEPGAKVLWRGYQKLNEFIMFTESMHFTFPFLKDMGNE